MIITAIVVIAGAWFVATLPNTIVDFWTALIVFIVIAIFEGTLRNWQKNPDRSSF